MQGSQGWTGVCLVLGYFSKCGNFSTTRLEGGLDAVNYTTPDYLPYVNPQFHSLH